MGDPTAQATGGASPFLAFALAVSSARNALSPFLQQVPCERPLGLSGLFQPLCRQGELRDK